MNSNGENQPLINHNKPEYNGINTTVNDNHTVQIENAETLRKGTSTLGAVFIVVNAAMGAGLLNMPYAFSNAGGIATAVALQMVFLCFIFVSLVMLAYLSSVYDCTTYQEVIEKVCGKIIGAMTEICIILYMFGTCIAMIIIIGDQFDKVMEAIFGPSFCHRFYLSRTFTMSIFSIIVILPLCFPKDIGFLKNSSIAGVISVLIVMVTVVVKYATSDVTPQFTPPNERDWTLSFAAIPAIFFAYQCHVSSVPIYATMENKSLKNWTVVLICSVALCAISYTATGICGYLNFGDVVSSDILESYDAKDWWVIIARVAIVTAMLTTYPILHFCGRAAFFTVRAKFCSALSHEDNIGEKLRRYMFTISWFAASLAMAIMIPNIGEAIAVVGGLAGCFILVFPGLAIIRYIMDEYMILSAFSIILAMVGVIITIGGIFLFGEITVKAIMDDISHSTPIQPSCYTTL